MGFALDAGASARAAISVSHAPKLQSRIGLSGSLSAHFRRGNRWHARGIVLRCMSVLVLIADDSADARALYAEYLEFCGFRVETAGDGDEAVRKAQAEWPAVILMDLAMPKMDGWEAIRRLRADPMTVDIPVVALSAYAFGDEPDRARAAGADLCLTKPCLPSQVGRVVRAMLLRRDVARSSA
jgi:two-component system cell cycle response regulator DivK